MPMTREGVRAILGENASKEAIDAILDMHSQSVGQNKGQIEDLQAQVAQLTEANAHLEEDAQSRMSESEKAEKALQDALKAQQKAEQRLAQAAAARELAEAGITGDDAQSLLKMVATGTEEQAVANAKAVAALVQARTKAAADQAKLEALGSTPAPAPGEPTGGKPTTVKDFLALPYEQQLELKTQNPDIISTLTQ